MNDLNITAANFGKNDNKQFLHDPAAYVKILGDATDINFHCLGYMEMEKTWSQKLEYAVSKTGIPSQTIRKDVVSQEFTLEGNLKQIQPETVALLAQRKVVEGTGFKRVVMGTKVPPIIHLAVALVTQTVDGKEVRLCIRNAQVTAEDLSIALGATEYASLPFKIEALRDEDPLGNNPDWEYIGKGTISGDLTSASATVSGLTLGTIDNIKVGGRIYGPAGIPTGATVQAVDYSSGSETITLSEAATATVDDATIYVELDTPDAEYDNVAFWKFAA